MFAAVISLRDKSWSDLRLFWSKRMPQYFLVCKGAGVPKQELAERVEFDIIKLVISEDLQRVDREDGYGPATEGQEPGNAYRLLSPDLHPDHHHPPNRDGLEVTIGSDEGADEGKGGLEAEKRPRESTRAESQGGARQGGARAVLRVPYDTRRTACRR